MNKEIIDVSALWTSMDLTSFNFVFGGAHDQVLPIPDRNGVDGLFIGPFRL